MVAHTGEAITPVIMTQEQSRFDRVVNFVTSNRFVNSLLGVNLLLGVGISPVIYDRLKIDSCPYVDEQAIAEVEVLFEQPETPGLMDMGHPKGPTFSRKAQVEAAEKSGLHFFNYQEEPLVKEKLDQAYALLNTEAGYAEAFQLYFESAQHFTRLYGIELSIGDEDTDYLYNGRAQDISEFTNLDAMNNLMALMNNLSNQPVELINLGGLKRIVLADTNEVAGYVMSDDDTYYANITDGFQEGLFRHEFMHLLDTRLCGGAEEMRNDPQYKNLNPVNVYRDQGGDPSGYSTYEAYKTRLETSRSPAQEGDDMMELNQRNRAAREDVIRKTDFSKMVTVSDYSFRNVVEDKGDTGEAILDAGSYPAILSEQTPVIRNKALILLARIYVQNKAIVQYIADTTPRTEHE